MNNYSKIATKSYKIKYISPFARRILRISAILSSIYLIIIIGLDDSLNILWGFLFVLIGLLSIYIFTKPYRKYYSPLIFSIFYFLGYILSLPSLIINKRFIPSTGWGGIGSFEFSDYYFLKLVIIVYSGMLGIIICMHLSEKILYRKSSVLLIDDDIWENREISEKFLGYWIFFWFIFSITLIVIMWHLEIGRTGLGSKRLPFKLSGIMIFTKNIVIPFCGIFFLDLCLKIRNRRIANIVLLLILIIGFLGSISGANRSSYAFTAFPALLYLFITSYKNNINKKCFYYYLILSTSLGILLVTIIKPIRQYAYITGNYNIHVISGITDTIVNAKYSEAIIDFFHLMTRRVGGIQELMAVASSGVSGIEIPFRLFIGDYTLSNKMVYEVYGYNPLVNEYITFGTSFGMWGQLFLSGSYLTVFIGTFVLLSIIIFIEEIFFRKRMNSISLLFSILLGIQFWNTAGLYYLNRFIILSIVCYLTGRMIYKNVKKIKYNKP